jgi:hypothetical protein
MIVHLLNQLAKYGVLAFGVNFAFISEYHGLPSADSSTVA